MKQGRLELMELPVSLELSEWYAFCLADPRESVRLTVLEEFAAIGVPAGHAETLRAIADADPSSICRERAAMLLDLEKGRGEAAQLAAGFEVTPQSLRGLLDQAGPGLRKALLSAVWNSPSPALLDLWRDALTGGVDDDLAAVGLSLLAQAGEGRDAVLASTFLAAGSAETVVAAVDLLFAHGRETLRERISGLLGHADPRVRFHAIRRLAAIDLREALRILHAAIDGEDSAERRRAITELALLPASETQSSFVRVLGLEVQPLLLVIAGRALVGKPTLKMPPLIYDIFLVSQGTKKHLLNLILRRMVRSIIDAGLVAGTPDEYLAALHRELESRRADLAVSLALRDLRHADAEVRRTVLEKIPPVLSDPRIQKALRTRLNLEVVPEIKEELARMLAEATGETTSETATEAIAEAQAASGQTGGKPLSGGSTGPGISGRPGPSAGPGGTMAPGVPMGSGSTTTAAPADISTVEGFRQEREHLLELMTKPGDRAASIRALKLFQRFGQREDVKHLAPLLTGKDADPAIVSHALKTIAALDFEAVADHLNPLLRSDDLAVRAAALEVYARCDKEGALQHLVSMLASPIPAVRRKGLAILPLFDVVSVEPLLLRLLRQDPLADVQAQAGFLLASNPTEAALKALFRHTHPAVRQPSPELAELWDTVRPAVATHFGQTVEAIDAWLSQRVAREDLADAQGITPFGGPGGGVQSRGKTAPEDAFTVAAAEAGDLSFNHAVAGLGVLAALFFVTVFLEEIAVDRSVEYKRPPEAISQVSSGTEPRLVLPISPTSQAPSGALPRVTAHGWKSLPGSWKVLPTSR